jgi:hypothetical protein
VNESRSLSGCRFVLKPLVDIRFMYGASAPLEHELSFSKRGKIFCASRGKRKLFFKCSDFEGARLDARGQHWVYGLGCGERFSREQFKAEERVVLDAGELFLRPSAKSAIQIFCEASAARPRHAGGAARESLQSVAARCALAAFAGELAAAEAAWGRGASDALASRLLSLHNFFLRFPHSPLSGPDAGCFWFRNVWLRDAFEGIRVNKAIYARTRPAWLASFFEFARRSSLNGLLPTRFDEFTGSPLYDSVDASLAFYPLALNFFEAKRAFSAFGKTLCAAEGFFDSLQGAHCRFKRFAEIEDFLLKTPANCSWTDSTSNGVPNRLPRAWRSPENARRKFFLVEVNASWLRFLASTGFLPEGANSFERVARSFKQKFFQPAAAFPTHIAGEASAVGLERAGEKSSLALEAVALLPELFSDSEVAALLERAKPLFVYRGGKLFGALLRERPEVFLGDAEYHGGVVWPRETPFLAALLSRVGRWREVEELLLNALDHQQNESTLFYSNELFSVDDAASGEVVPVKNPAQYWSNWVQPFFDYLWLAPHKDSPQKASLHKDSLKAPRAALLCSSVMPSSSVKR